MYLSTLPPPPPEQIKQAQPGYSYILFLTKNHAEAIISVLFDIIFRFRDAVVDAKTARRRSDVTAAHAQPPRPATAIT